MKNKTKKLLLGAAVVGAASTAAGFFYGYRMWHPAVPKPIAGKKHIVCIGDSITYGAGVKPHRRGRESYPAYLQRMLGAEYQVMNFGLSGRTLLSSGDSPYTKEPHYEKSLEVEDPLYIVMLGTNDSKPYNWNESRFRQEMTQMLKTYQDRGGVILLIPPKAFAMKGKTAPAFDIQDEIIQDEQEILTDIAVGFPLPVVDLYESTRQHPEWFSDGVHPNAKGNEEIARHVFDAVKEQEEKPGDLET